MNHIKNIKLFRRLKIINILLILGLIIIISLQIVASFSLNALTQSTIFSLKKPTNFLIIGSDVGGGRSISANHIPLADSLMLVSLNPDNIRGNISLNSLSIPRDTEAAISCGNDKKDKINSSLSLGYSMNRDIKEGIECTKETVENLFDITIDHYVYTDFDGLINTINTLDGININVPYKFCEQDSTGKMDTICLEAGEQTLNGEQALAYARQRKAINPETKTSGDDWERNVRQQEVIAGILKKIIANPASNAPKLYDIVTKDMKTTLNVGTLTELGNFAISTYNSLIDGLSASENLTVFFKNTDHARTVGIDSLENIFNFNNTNTSKPFKDLLKIDSSEYDNYYDDTTVDPIILNNYNLNLGTKTFESVTMKNIEFFMGTINTENSTNGTSNQIIHKNSIEYFKELFKENSLMKENK